MTAAILSLLFSCVDTGNQESSNRQSIHFERSPVNYAFTSKTTIFGLGDPFDFAYFYDDKVKQELVYQIVVEEEDDIRLLKFQLKSGSSEPVFIDTLYLEDFFVGPKTHSLWMFVDQEHKINIIKKDIIKHGAIHKDSIYQYNQDHLVYKKPVDLLEDETSRVVSYSSRFNTIISSKYLGRIVPFFEYSVPLSERLDVPSLIDLKNEQELWPLSHNYDTLSEKQYGLVETPFTIFLDNRICQLSPGVATIDVYYPDSGKMESVEIPGVPFDRSVSENTSTYRKVVEKECDYWFDFKYNQYSREFYLFQHIGNDYFDDDGEIIDVGAPYDWGRVLILDNDFQYLGDTIISVSDEIKTIIHPKFPCLDGYWTTEIESIENDSSATIFNVRLQKMILHEI